ncbi:FtsK/SpoIIIE domain-containing protein [Streptomyces sp. BA2]|uniref:FtsK/SpoIIIE domain-containing protein n=1 Tax=Streptomyces sp. BA2 TaxID=436595 RepID=UPI003014BCCE
MSLAEISQLAPILVGAGLALIFVWLVWWIVRYIRADAMLRASILQAGRVRRGWKRLAPMAGLSVTDRTPTMLASLTTKEGQKPEPRILTPVIKVTPDRFGVVVRAKCLPKVSREEFQKAARFLADAWGCVRVSVTPDLKPGYVIIRGVREDPLAITTTHVPTGAPPKDVTCWNLGTDEYGVPASATIKEVPGVTVAGLPGYGKTSLINRLICDFAPSPLVQFAVIDGKASKAEQGDYASIAHRLFRYVGDDVEEANAFLTELVELRERRAQLTKSVFGTTDMWHKGPREDWPIVFLIIDEAHTFFRDHKGRDEKSKRLAALAAENARLVEDLVKKGRSSGIVTLPLTQKATGDAIPTFIRDVCPYGLSFAQKTTDASVAALGDNIREWPDMDPVELQGPDYVGVLVMKAHDRKGFIRIRTPYVSDADTARIAEATAHLMRCPILLLDDLAGGRLVLRKVLPPDDDGGPLVAA